MFGRRNSGYWADVSPTGAIGDLVAVVRDAGSRRWRIGALAALTTCTLFSLLAGEQRIVPRPPHIIYITTFRPGRSDAEIRAGNIANQKHQDFINAQLQKRAELERDMYKAMGRASGFDVDAMDRQARADNAAEARAQDAKLAALYGGGHASAAHPATKAP